MDSDLLDVLITWDQTGSYEVGEISGGGVSNADDWMTVLLQTKAFHRIPPANLQALFMRMQHIACKAGDVVIKQGDEGDYFYVITKGSAVVTRETPMNRAGIKLAEAGDRRVIRRRSADIRRQAQCDHHDGDRWRAGAPRQGRFPGATE